MASLKLQLTPADTRAAFRTLETLARDFTPVTKAYGQYMVRRTRQRFTAQTSPNGQPFAALSPAYATRKRAHPTALRKILQFGGELRDNFVAFPTGSDVTISSNLKVGTHSLAAIHHFGAPAANIPARPILGLDAQDRQELKDTVRDWLIQGRV